MISRTDPVIPDKVFNLERYAAGVANELLWALEGLVDGSGELRSEELRVKK